MTTRASQEEWEAARDRIALHHDLSPTKVAAALAELRSANVPLPVAELELRGLLRRGMHNVIHLARALAVGYRAGWRERTLRSRPAVAPAREKMRYNEVMSESEDPWEAERERALEEARTKAPPRFTATVQVWAEVEFEDGRPVRVLATGDVDGEFVHAVEVPGTGRFAASPEFAGGWTEDGGASWEYVADPPQDLDAALVLATRTRYPRDLAWRVADPAGDETEG